MEPRVTAGKRGVKARIYIPREREKRNSNAHH